MRVQRDGGDVDIFAWFTRRAPLREALQAEQTRDELRLEMDSARRMAGGKKRTAKEAWQKQLRRLVRAVLAEDRTADFDQHRLPERSARMLKECCASLETDGAIGLPELKMVGETEIERALPLLEHGMQRRLLMQRLRTAAERAETAATATTDSAAFAAGLADGADDDDARACAHGSWLLGGLDQRPGAGQLRQEGSNLVWCGNNFAPYTLTTDAATLKTDEVWLRAFIEQLLAVLQKPAFFDMRAELLLWRCATSGVRYPLLMYMPPVGDVQQCDGHPGQIWEVGPNPVHIGVYTVNALSPNGLHAFARLPVYTNDARVGLATAATWVAAGAGEAGGEPTTVEPWTSVEVKAGSEAGSDTVKAELRSNRFQFGFIFGKLLTPSGNLIDRPGMGRSAYGSDSMPTVVSLTVRRTRSAEWLKADRHALRHAQLGQLAELEWLVERQQLVHPDTLQGLLPGILIEAYEFWQSGDDVIWGYPTMTEAERRKTEREEAEKRGKIIDETCWYDGYAMHLTLFDRNAGESSVLDAHDGDAHGRSQPRRALIRRLPWRAPPGIHKVVDRPGSGIDGPMTLLHAGQAPLSSTVQQLLSLLTRLTVEGDILFWTASVVLKADEECVLAAIQIPRLSLVFVPQVISAKSSSGVGEEETLRFVSDDLGGMMLCTDTSPEVEPGLQPHLAGVRHGVWLRNSEHEYQLLLPLLQLAPYSMRTHNVLLLSEYLGTTYPREVEKRFGTAYFLYPLHASRSHLRIASVAAALYLLLIRMLTQRFTTCPPLVKQAFVRRTGA